MWHCTGLMSHLSLVNENVIPYCNVKMSSPLGYRLPPLLGRDRPRRRASPRVGRGGAPSRARGISRARAGIDIAAPLSIVRCSASCGLGPHLGGGGSRRGPPRPLLLGPREVRERPSHRRC